MNYRQKWAAALIAALYLLVSMPIGWTETIPDARIEVAQTVETATTQAPEPAKGESSAAFLENERVEATATPEPSEISTASASPEPDITPEATVSPEASESPAASVSSEPEATVSPEASETPEASVSPEPEATVSPEASVLPEVEDQQPEDVPEPAPTMETPERDKRIGWKGVVPSNEKGMAIPMLFQSDYRTPVCYYNGAAKSVATSGCGAASVSMVIAYLTGNTEQNPYRLFCQAVDEGRYYGNGLNHNTLSHFADEYGVKSKWISNDGAAILSALQEGKPVIAHMGEGIFTEKGHYIVLRGVTEDGLILLNDPNNPSNCSKAFPIQTLLREARTSAAFMVCWVEETQAPTAEPTAAPTAEPTADPTIEPTAEPTVEPTVEPRPAAEKEALWGDVNGSGRVDMNDVQIIYDVCNGKWTDDEALLARCDLNENGAIDILDVQTLANYVRTGDIGADS